MDNSKVLSGWFADESVIFWHAAVRITVDGAPTFHHAVFGDNDRLAAFEDSISQHFAIFPSEIGKHEEKEMLFPMVTLGAANAVGSQHLGGEHSERSSLPLGGDMLGKVCLEATQQVDPQPAALSRNEHYYDCITSCFPSLSGKKLHGFFIAKEVSGRPTRGVSGFSVVAFYASDEDQNASSITRAIEQLSLELLRLAVGKLKILAESTEEKRNQAEIFKRLREPYKKLGVAVSIIAEFYDAMQAAILGPGAPLWFDRSANRAFIRAIYAFEDANFGAVELAGEWLKTIHPQLRCAHNGNEMLNTYWKNKNASTETTSKAFKLDATREIRLLHHRVVTLLFAGISKDEIFAMRNDLELDEGKFFQAHEKLAPISFLRHFFQCAACIDPQKSVALFSRHVFHGSSLESMADFTEWLGLQLLAAGFDVCPHSCFSNEGALINATRQSLMRALNTNELSADSFSLYLTNFICLSAGIGYRFDSLSFTESSLQYKFVANPKPQISNEPLQKSGLRDNAIQQGPFLAARFSTSVSRDEAGVLLIVKWGSP